MKQSVPLAIACGNYDRTRPLFDGRVRIEGCDPIFLPQPPEEIFFRAFVHKEFDVSFVAEQLCHASLAGRLPLCRHPGFYFAHVPAFRDLCADRPRHQPTSRSARPPCRDPRIPADGCGVGPWAAAGRLRGIAAGPSLGVGRHGNARPRREGSLRRAERRRAGRNAGGQDIIGHAGDRRDRRAHRAAGPSCFTRGVSNVARLFTNFGADEEEYYRRTGIFPIMHIVGVKTELATRHPWLPASLYKAFLAAKNIALAALSDPNALTASLPSQLWSAERAKALMGEDFWSYGLDENAKTLEVFLRYHVEQGLSQRRLTPGELFASSTTSQWKI